MLQEHTCPLRWSTVSKEGVLHTAKHFKHQALIDSSEMAALLEWLDPCLIYITSEPVAVGETHVPHRVFLAKYAEYITALQSNQLPDMHRLRPFFSAIFTATTEDLYAVPLSQERCLVKTTRPVIQLQTHRLNYSSIDQKFYPMALTREGVFWGLQFSYPQIYQDPKTHAFIHTVKKNDLPNTQLFYRLTCWLRRHTVPTPVVLEGKTLRLPIRLGKRCDTWISLHPQLAGQPYRIGPIHKKDPDERTV